LIAQLFEDVEEDQEVGKIRREEDRKVGI